MFGGFPGMDSMGGRRRKVDNSKYYDTLGVPKDANASTIKKAYRKLAMTHHPDKGGDEDRFKEITTAFEVLSDDEKRQLYDEYGEEGLREGGGGPSDAHDLFSAMFGGGGPQSRGPRKGDNVVHSLRVTLEDLYKGKMSKLAIIRNRVCKGCDGLGATAREGVSKCHLCDGHGVRVTLSQIGPGMVQQVQSNCSNCRGTGEIIVERFRCTVCNGEKVTKERKVLEVYVDKGMQNGQKITFSGEANAIPGYAAGDVVVVLKQEEHSVFTRKENNLIIEKEISLSDALCGAEFCVKQLDGRLLHVRSQRGAVIAPSTLKSIRGEGMPTWKNPTECGFMFIKLSIRFPQVLGQEERVAVQQVLGPCTPLEHPPAEMEEVDMLDFQNEHLRSGYSNGSAYDEDDEDHQPKVQCAQG